MSLHDVISYRYGITDIFISDQGTKFVNNIARNLNARAGCTHQVTSPYHPQANGLVERLNRTTTDRLKVLYRETRRLGVSIT